MSPPDVQLWWCDLRTVPSELEGRLEGLLSASEFSRAQHYQFEQRRRQSRVARAVLRALLSTCLRSDPTGITFGYDAYGRPVLTESAAADIEFNLAHSRDLIVWAVSNGARVGVDVECCPDESLMMSLPWFCSPNEEAIIRRLDRTTQRLVTWRNWVRKEAILKGIGRGLQQSLTELTLPIDVRQPTTSLTRAANYENWSLYEVHPVHDYLGALAVCDSAARIAVRLLDIEQLLAEVTALSRAPLPASPRLHTSASLKR